MKIREEQKQALLLSLEDNFVQRMVRHLWNDFPKQCEAQALHEEDMESLVRQGMDRARDYGLFSEGEIQRYLECMVIFGPEFDQNQKYPWASDILNSADLNSSQKSEALAWNMFTEVEWEESPDG